MRNISKQWTDSFTVLLRSQALFLGWHQFARKGKEFAPFWPAGPLLVPARSLNVGDYTGLNPSLAQKIGPFPKLF
jgi:hypothetical protein